MVKLIEQHYQILLKDIKITTINFQEIISLLYLKCTLDCI